MDSEKEVLNIDMRIPVSVSKEFVMEKLTSAAAIHGFEISENDYLRSIYTPLDSPLVKSLMDAYQEVTGDLKSEPIIRRSYLRKSHRQLRSLWSRFPAQRRDRAPAKRICDDRGPQNRNGSIFSGIPKAALNVGQRKIPKHTQEEQNEQEQCQMDQKKKCLRLRQLSMSSESR